MNIRLMRLIDRFVGVPLCWGVGVFCQLYDSLRKPDPTRAISEILVIKFFGMGSILLATPAIALMRTAYPHSRITFISFQNNRELLERLSSVDHVMTIESRSLGTFLRDSAKMIVHLSTHRYDIVFDLEFFSKFSTFLCGISRARVRAAFALPTHWRSLIVNHPAPLDRHRNVAYSFCQIVSDITGTPPAGVPVMEPPTISDMDRESLLGKIPIAAKRIIAVNVNAGDTFLERRWPMDRFAELVSRLASEDDTYFCFTGTASEHEYVRATISKTRCPERCFNAAGVLTIPELGALLRLSEMLISNDSGPLHLAAALGVPTIGIFGPESPTFYGPLGNLDRSVYQGISCSPCMNVYSAKDFRCPFDALCVKRITVQEVLSHIFVTTEVA